MSEIGLNQNSCDYIHLSFTSDSFNINEDIEICSLLTEKDENTFIENIVYIISDFKNNNIEIEVLDRKNMADIIKNIIHTGIEYIIVKNRNRQANVFLFGKIYKHIFNHIRYDEQVEFPRHKIEISFFRIERFIENTNFDNDIPSDNILKMLMQKKIFQNNI